MCFYNFLLYFFFLFVKFFFLPLFFFFLSCALPGVLMAACVMWQQCGGVVWCGVVGGALRLAHVPLPVTCPPLLSHTQSLLPLPLSLLFFLKAFFPSSPNRIFLQNIILYAYNLYFCNTIAIVFTFQSLHQLLLPTFLSLLFRHVG